MDFHAVGPAGYLEARYQYDGETVATCVLYLRTNSAFIPLQSTNDITARMAWDKTQFELLRQWLEGHLPKVTDLGVVEVSESKPTRVELGAGAACILTTRVLNHPDVTNLWFTVDLAKETADLPGKNRSQQHRSINQPDKAVGFSIDGRFYRVTPRLIDPIRKPDK